MEDSRKKPEERVLRIDHSDVYLENDKLDEELDQSLNNLSRFRHRQYMQRDEEIKELRQALNTMTLKKRTSSVSRLQLRPQTSPTFRRMRIPRVVKLDVHVPSNVDDSIVNDSNNVNTESDTTDNENDESDNEVKLFKKRMLTRRCQSARNEFVEIENHDSKSGSTKHENVIKLTKQQMLLKQLQMQKVPEAWLTKVLPATDTNVKRRAKSAVPSPSTERSPSSKRRGKQRKTFRRPKTAMPVSSAPALGDMQTDSFVICGGQPQNFRSNRTLSRRQLIELTSATHHVDFSETGNSCRQHMLESVRLERERLDVKVKLFLKSCDQMKLGGGINSRRERNFENFVLNNAIYI